MERKEKRVFTAAAVCSAVLVLSTLMGLAGAVSSAGGFSFFAAVCIAGFLALVYLTAVLFRKKKDIHLGLAFGVNALVSLLTVCFFFSWQELFICLTLIVLTADCFAGNHRAGKEKYWMLAVSLPAAGILIATATGLISHAAQPQNARLAFDMGRWAYYFSPFLFAVLYTALADLAALAVNERPELKSGCRVNRLALLPALLLILTVPVTAAAAAAGGKGVSGVLLTVSAAAVCLSAAAFPFLCSFLNPDRQK